MFYCYRTGEVEGGASVEESSSSNLRTPHPKPQPEMPATPGLTWRKPTYHATPQDHNYSKQKSLESEVSSSGKDSDSDTSAFFPNTPNKKSETKDDDNDESVFTKPQRPESAKAEEKKVTSFSIVDLLDETITGGSDAETSHQVAAQGDDVPGNGGGDNEGAHEVAGKAELETVISEEIVTHEDMMEVDDNDVLNTPLESVSDNANRQGSPTTQESIADEPDRQGMHIKQESVSDGPDKQGLHVKQESISNEPDRQGMHIKQESVTDGPDKQGLHVKQEGVSNEPDKQGLHVKQESVSNEPDRQGLLIKQEIISGEADRQELQLKQESISDKSDPQEVYVKQENISDNPDKQGLQLKQESISSKPDSAELVERNSSDIVPIDLNNVSRPSAAEVCDEVAGTSGVSSTLGVEIEAKDEEEAMDVTSPADTETRTFPQPMPPQDKELKDAETQEKMATALSDVDAKDTKSETMGDAGQSGAQVESVDSQSKSSLKRTHSQSEEDVIPSAAGGDSDDVLGALDAMLTKMMEAQEKSKEENKEESKEEEEENKEEEEEEEMEGVLDEKTGQLINVKKRKTESQPGEQAEKLNSDTSGEEEKSSMDKPGGNDGASLPARNENRMEVGQSDAGDKKQTSQSGVDQSDVGDKKQTSQSGVDQSDAGDKKKTSQSGVDQSDAGDKKQTSQSGVDQSDAGDQKQTSQSVVNESDAGDKKQTNQSGLDQSDAGEQKQTSQSATTSTAVASDKASSAKDDTDSGAQTKSPKKDPAGKKKEKGSVEKKDWGKKGALDVKYKGLVERCLKAMLVCLSRFPQHYKSLFRLAHTYFICLPVKVSSDIL